jgi:hypothetical protein
VDAVIVPATAVGGSGILNFSGTQAQIIAVEENETALSVSPESLNLRVTRVRSYLEAIGVLAAHKAGIDGRAIRSQIDPLSPLRLSNQPPLSESATSLRHDTLLK